MSLWTKAANIVFDLEREIIETSGSLVVWWSGSGFEFGPSAPDSAKHVQLIDRGKSPERASIDALDSLVEAMN